MKLSQLLLEINDLAKELNINQPYICGGLPRDKYLGLQNVANDIDLTTGAPDINILAKAIAEKYKKNNAKLVLKTNHYCVTFGDTKLDFSSHFLSSYVSANSSLQKEMLSRDFNINTLLMSLDLKKTYDPTRLAIKDLDAKIIDTCLPPEQTFTDQPNRAIRAVYLACKLNFKLSDRLYKYLKENSAIFSLIPKKYLVKRINNAISYNKEYFDYLVKDLSLQNYLIFDYEQFKNNIAI